MATGEAAANMGLDDLVGQRRKESLIEQVVNPFENPAPSGCYHWVKAIIVFFTIFPIRLVILILSFFFLILFTKLAVCCGGTELINDRGCLYHTEPLSRCRRIILMPCPLCIRGVLFGFGFWWISVNDRRKKNDVKPNIVVVAPHVSLFDPMIAATLFPPLPSEVGKKELMEGALGLILGGPAIASQGIFVDRERKESRQACKEAIAMRASKKWTGPPTFICPEGTCTNGKALIAFKGGPFLPGEPVQPIALQYPYKHLNVGWTGDFAVGAGMVKLLFLCMLQFANHAHAEIMEPIVPTEEEVKDAELFAFNVRAKMAEFLKVPVTSHSYADAAMSLKAIPLNVGSDFQVDDVTGRFGLGSDQLLAFLKEFKAIDKSRHGAISLTEFTKIVSKSSSEALKNERVTGHLFQLFDTDHSGFLSYRELVQALVMLSDGSGTSEGRTKLCFLLCDPRDDGILPRELLKKAIVAGGKLTPEVQAQLDTLPAEISYEKFTELAGQNPGLVAAAVKLMPAMLRDMPKVPEKEDKKKKGAGSDVELTEQKKDVEAQS